MPTNNTNPAEASERHEGDEIIALADGTTSTKLIKTIRNGEIEAAREYIEAGANLNIPDSLGNTPIMYLVENGCLDEAKWLLEQYHNPETPEERKLEINVLNHFGVSLLTNILDEIRNRFETQDKGRQQEYSREDWYNLVKDIISKSDCDINLRGIYNFTPLWMAARHNLDWEVQLLLSQDNIDPELKFKKYVKVKDSNTGEVTYKLDSSCYSHGTTPLHIAAISDNSAVLKTMLDSEKVNINAFTEPNGYNIVHLTILVGNDKALEQVLEKAREKGSFAGSKINITSEGDKLASSPLLHATMLKRSDIVKQLLEFKDVRDTATTSNLKNKIPHFESLNNNDFESFEGLLYNTDISSLSPKIESIGSKVLDIHTLPSLLVGKANEGFLSSTKLKQYINYYPNFYRELLKADKLENIESIPDIVACKDGTYGTISLAAAGCKLNLFEWSLNLADKQGYDRAEIINMKHNKGGNTLTSAMFTGSPEIVKRALEEGANTNSRDVNDRTPLFNAISWSAIKEGQDQQNNIHTIIDYLTEYSPEAITAKAHEGQLSILHIANACYMRDSFLNIDFHKQLLSKDPELIKSKTNSGVQPLTVFYSLLETSETKMSLEKIPELYLARSFTWKGVEYQKPKANIFVKTKSGESLVKAALGSGHEETIIPIMKEFYKYESLEQAAREKANDASSENSEEENNHGALKEIYYSFEKAFERLKSYVKHDNYDAHIYKLLLAHEEKQQELIEQLDKGAEEFKDNSKLVAAYNSPNDLLGSEGEQEAEETG